MSFLMRRLNVDGMGCWKNINRVRTAWSDTVCESVYLRMPREERGDGGRGGGKGGAPTVATCPRM